MQGRKNVLEKKNGDLTPPRLHSRQSSAAAAALSDCELRKTVIAAAVGCSGWFGVTPRYFGSNLRVPCRLQGPKDSLPIFSFGILNS